MTTEQINKAAEELECLWLIHRKTNWPHEYAENGIVNFSGLKKIVESALSHSRQEIEELKAENDKLREALKGLMSNPMINLGDKIYEVRDREGKGWDGPHVVQWGKAVETARKLIEGQ